jgi:hypothetical protein
MRTTMLFLVGLLGVGLTSGVRAADARPRYTQRWFYSMYNLQVDKSADELIALIRRAGKSGYNGVVLADYKLNVLHRVPKFYFKNVERVKKAAAAAGIEIIPAVAPIGYSSGLLAHDPNLAEGIPVKDAPFTVKGRIAVLSAAPPKLRNGDLEEVRGDTFAGMLFQDGAGKISFADRKTVRRGKVSLRMEDVGKGGRHGMCRIAQRVKVRPHACYRFSCWVKTRDLKPSGAFRLLAVGGKGGRSLTFHEGRLKPTQDWAEVEVVFNSLDQSEVIVYAGQWGGRSGTLWLDDLRLEELSLVNVLRRPGCPFTVASANGKTVHEEGKDYQPVRDPKLGQTPWAGEYSFRHRGAILRLTGKSRIKDGDRLRVSWYHPVLVHGEQVMCCLSEKKVFDVLRDQVKRVNDLLKPRTFFLSHDEIRVANWCHTCRKTKRTPGELLADNVKRCVDIVRKVNPRARIIIWSDMFDPHHNAVDNYYLVNGTLKGSWKGLRRDVVIANWNGGKAAASLKWFAGRGHAQIIAGYYDEPGLRNFERWQKAARGVPKVTGFLYTTWGQNYKDLEKYGKAMSGK